MFGTSFSKVDSISGEETELYILKTWIFEQKLIQYNCFGFKHETIFPPIAEPKFESLETILMDFCPNIGYLQYKAIEEIICDEQKSSEIETLSKKVEKISSVKKFSINLKALFDIMTKLNLINWKV